MSDRSSRKVVVVTGGSRGLGRGIARAFGSKGARVYLTGRGTGGDALEHVAEEVRAAGGEAVAVVCDHNDDAQVEALFDRIRTDAGRLDILVNNAAAVYPQDLIMPEPFWEKPLRLVDMIDVGLRSNYVTSYYAAPIFVAQRSGLIANISFYGAVSYFHGPAYGAAKAGTDKLSYDMALDFRPYGVAVVSIWPGFIRTEMIAAMPIEMMPPDLAANLHNFESPDFTGLVIDALSQDPARMELSGQALIGAELAERYGIVDLDGSKRPSYRSTLGEPPRRFTPAPH